MKYHVWRIPTLQGVRAFKWKAKRVTSEPLSKEGAGERAHELRLDEQAPDFSTFAGYHVLPAETDPAFIAFFAEEFPARLEAAAVPGMTDTASWDRRAAWLLWCAEARDSKPALDLLG